MAKITVAEVDELLAGDIRATAEQLHLIICDACSRGLIVEWPIAHPGETRFKPEEIKIYRQTLTEF